MIGLDTNVIVRYLVRDDPGQTSRATALINGLSQDTPGFIATVAWAEIHWVLTRAYRFDRVTVVESLAALYAVEEVRAEDPAAVTSAISQARFGADFADALIAATARRAGCSEVFTFDKRAATKLGWQIP